MQTNYHRTDFFLHSTDLFTILENKSHYGYLGFLQHHCWPVYISLYLTLGREAQPPFMQTTLCRNPNLPFLHFFWLNLALGSRRQQENGQKHCRNESLFHWSICYRLLSWCLGTVHFPYHGLCLIPCSNIVFWCSMANVKYAECLFAVVMVSMAVPVSGYNTLVDCAKLSECCREI